MSSPWSAGSEMLSNAEYIEKELPKLFLSDELRAQVLELCKSWTSTYFDLIDDALSHGLAETWVERAIHEANIVVRALDAASIEDSSYGSAYILVSENAVNVMKAFGEGAEAPAPSTTPSTPTAAPPKKHFMEEMAQAMVDNLNRASIASHEAEQARLKAAKKPDESKPSYWTRTAAIIRAVKKNLQRSK